VEHAEKGSEKLISCGYGLLGLCCSACLLGPCRLTPFEEEPSKGHCGDNRDRIVAGNLLRLAAREASLEIHALREAILKVGDTTPAFPHINEIKPLLSSFPENTGAWVSSLYPEKTFPGIRQIFGPEGFPPSSLINLLLDSDSIADNDSSDIEQILRQSIRLSLAALISAELRIRLGRSEAELSSASERFLSTSRHVLVHVSESGFSSIPSLGRSGDELRKQFEETAPVVSVREASVLAELGRKLYQKWGLPPVDLKAAVLICSRKVTSVLGALGLGYNVVSLPPLPLHGSARVEEFFSEEFRLLFGNAYLPSWQDDTMGKILG
jgi:hypothetical protein